MTNDGVGRHEARGRHPLLDDPAVKAALRSGHRIAMAMREEARAKARGAR